MTFSRLSVEKYFLIPEGALGKRNKQPGDQARPAEVWWEAGSHARPCKALRRVCGVMDQGVLGHFLLSHPLFAFL